MTFLDRIKQVGAERGLSLTQIEELAGIKNRTMYRWDKNLPSVDKAQAVANTLNVSLSWLFTGKSESDSHSLDSIDKYNLNESMTEDSKSGIMSIVDRIKQTAANRNISISELEKNLGFTSKSVYKWDKSEPSISKMVSVANLLQVPLYWLATGKNESFAEDSKEGIIGLADRIRSCAAEKGLTLAGIEKELGFGNSSIRKWDRNSPSIDKVIATAKFLNVSLSWLVTGKNELVLEDFRINNKYDRLPDDQKKLVEGIVDTFLAGNSSIEKKSSQEAPNKIVSISDKNPSSDQDQHDQTRSIYPVAILGYVAAGKPIEGISIPIGYVNAPDPADYCLIAKGHSMEPVILDGEQIFVKSSDSLSPGDIGIFYIDGDVTCKEYHPQPDSLILRSLNPDFKPFKFALNEFHDFKIQGKVLLTYEQKLRLQ